jgi:predicted ester cyclase
MSIEHNKKLVEYTFERLFNHGEISIADEVVSEEFINYDAPPDAPTGPAGLRYIVTQLRTAFPDIHFEVEEMVAEDDKVVARTTMSGTHLGDFFGIAPTGRRVAQEQIHILRFENGKTVEHRAVRDDLGTMQQLGVIPVGASSAG